MTLELFVETRKIRRGLATVVDAPRSWPEQGLLQPSVIPAFRQRPIDARCLRAFQIFVNRALPHRATAGDLPLPQS